MFEEENYYYLFVSNENLKETSQIFTYVHSNPFHSILDSRTVLTINQKRATFRSNANRNAFETVGKVAQRNTWKEGRYVRNRLIPLGRCRSQWRGARDRKKGVKDGPSRKPVHTYTWGGLALVISLSATVTKVKTSYVPTLTKSEQTVDPVSTPCFSLPLAGEQLGRGSGASSYIHPPKGRAPE